MGGKLVMKLLMENWRKYLTEEKKHPLEQMATMQGWSTEQTIARIVMSGDPKRAFEMLKDHVLALRSASTRRRFPGASRSIY